MAGREKQNTKLVILIVLILLTVVGCGRQENRDPQEIVPIQQEPERVIAEETPAQSQNIFVQMLANHPLHRHGELSSDNRYYAYEERSSIILVRLPTAEEYEADPQLLPKVLFTDGIKAKSSFAELEADYARRLKKPLLTEKELTEISSKLRSVYDWKNFYYQKFSQDGQYLAYLGFNNFGSDRTCTVYVLDIKENCKLYSLPIKENSEYAELNWLADNQTLEIYLPHAEVSEGESLALRRQWHFPSGKSQLAYYIKDGTADRQEIALADAQKVIAVYAQAEAERQRAEEEWAKLTVEQLVTALTAEELASEYAKYFSLHPEQKRQLQERGYSDEVIAKMDSFDFEQEEKGWLLSEEIIEGLQRSYPQLKDRDLSNWTNQEYEEYLRAQSDENTTPPEAIKKEILKRGLPKDISWRVAKEFHGWENMLAYTNEAILAMYEAVKETDVVFSKGEAYRLAVRTAYLGRK